MGGMVNLPVARRRFLAACAAVGAGGLFPGILWSLAARATAADSAASRVTKEMIGEAARVAGVDIPEASRDAMLASLATALDDFDAIRKLAIPNSVAPAFAFDPVPLGMKLPAGRAQSHASSIKPRSVPEDLEELAFASVRELSELLRRRKITSVGLTHMYIDRLRRLDPHLHCVVTLTIDRALEQAHQADADMARGIHRGLLHGIPWGAKDLLAVKGYPTTWGARGMEAQVIDEDATVVKRLDAAGAVLIAKLSLGALAMGDRWFGGITRNPWSLEQGSSGSSAGAASAVSAGCVGFAIGSETLGSISSPSTRCGVTGLRPTFGRVPRTGAMALSWTMDKLGPIARTVEDCALVLEAIHGPDGMDPTVRDVPFAWDASRKWTKLRIGWIPSAFAMPEEDGKASAADIAAARAERAFDVAALDTLRASGANLVEVELPDMPWGAMVQILVAEAAAAFDDLTRSGRDALLDGQTPDDWPNIFRAARFVPAVEYIQASRARTLAIAAMAKVFERCDVIVVPTSGVQLVATNLTGHPAIILPNGFRAHDAPQPKGANDEGGPGTPVSLTFLGQLHGEADLCAIASAYQRATRFHLAQPALPAKV